MKVKVEGEEGKEALMQALAAAAKANPGEAPLVVVLELPEAEARVRTPLLVARSRAMFSSLTRLVGAVARRS